MTDSPIIYTWVTDEGQKIRWSTKLTAVDPDYQAKKTRQRVVFTEYAAIMPSCHGSQNLKEWKKEDRKVYRRFRSIAAKGFKAACEAEKRLQQDLEYLAMNWLVGNLN